MITLFEHNQTAYEAAVSMLHETGKAAVIHPTGTGKSFIAFKLCEDHPDKVVCWLSPSEYIFRTQLENLKAAGADIPRNIRFYTYAKLMNMTNEEMADIQPDLAVYDEFHRGGAALWGAGLQRFRDMYPNIPTLGLSATAIRYLDNQRDMADELFDSNIASEMTLGESIVRGILDPPKYVLSVYAYQRDLEKYKVRVRRAKNRAARDAAEKYLEALRRALDKADGLDEIFSKHMTDRTGKYIVFCANAEHMHSMMDKAGEWFAKVDPQPRIYSFYSEDPEAVRSFNAFKADHDNSHLRFLYCIDALNEGVHVEDVSGVILLRPTVSPIIYKQQIGRALSANKKTDAVIFDVVMNIENLCSIDMIEEEMRVAMTYYRFFGEEENIVNEQFQIIDEVRSCRELFEKLNETLTVSWDLMYAQAKAYFDEHGHLDVPRRYRTQNGYSLGSWLFTQRRVYAGEQSGTLGETRIAKLNAIGMVWDSFADQLWKKNYAAARKYHEEYGALNVPAKYVAENGVALGKWISNLRSFRKSGARIRYLTPEHIEALDKIGMIWSVPDHQWEQNYNAAMQYHRAHGDLDIPAGYVDPGGIRLGAWIYNMRKSYQGKYVTYRITEEQIAKLTELGMVWESSYTVRWEKGFSEAVRYREANGHLDVPATYQTASGYRLGGWISDQREKYRSGKMPERRIARLESIGMIWQKENPWEVRFRLAEEYFKANGHLRVPAKYSVQGIWLNKWVNEQKQAYRGNRKQRLTAEQVRRLEGIGMVWDKRPDGRIAAGRDLASAAV